MPICFPHILCANIILSQAFFVIMSNTPNILHHSVESQGRGTINTFVLEKQWSHLFFHIYPLHMLLHLRLNFFGHLFLIYSEKITPLLCPVSSIVIS